MLKHTLALVATLSCTLTPMLADACSVAFWNDNPQAKVVARSVDLYMSDMPQMFVQPAGIARDGGAGKNSIKWTSQYGSVIMTAFHTNAVTDGMNEHGLAAHLLYLENTEYEKEDGKKPTLSNLMWSQYILDNFKTVNEAVKSIEQYQILSAKAGGREWPIHLAIEDASGDSAIVEFINGKAKIHHGKQYSVMTNEPAYDIQLENLKKYKLFGGTLSMPGDVDPLSRFVRIASYLKTLPKPNDYIEAVAGALSVMRTAMVPFGAEDTSGSEATDSWPTRWVSLADLTNKIYYFSSTSAPNVVWVDFKNVDFKTNAPIKMVDPTDIHFVGEISAHLKAQ